MHAGTVYGHGGCVIGSAGDDRNPQTYVPNIFWAKPADYQKAEQRIWHAPGHQSYVELPLVKE